MCRIATARSRIFICFYLFSLSLSLKINWIKIPSGKATSTQITQKYVRNSRKINRQIKKKTKLVRCLSYSGFPLSIQKE